MNPNPYVQGLVKTLKSRYSVESVGMTTGDWICANTRSKGLPFKFTGYDFQREIVNDLHPNLAVKKISQVGLTEIQMRKALALVVRNVGMVGIFSLPNEKMYKRFYQSRMKPVLDGNSIFNSETDSGAVRSMDLVQFGESFLNIVNATEGSATSTSADFVFNDEVDLSDQKALALFASRLQNSSHKIRQQFSTPTWQGFGIDASYAASDQREYFCRCHACRHWQVPLWDRRWVKIPGLPDSTELNDITSKIVETLKLDEALVVCESCGAPLDLDDPEREWVASFPSRENGRGYWVRPFSSGRITVPYIIQQLLDYTRLDFVRGWYNTVIGESYSDSSARLEERQIKVCMGSAKPQEISSDLPVFIGIDMGLVCHVTLGTPRNGRMEVFSFEVVNSRNIVNHCRELMQRYNIIAGACDRHPYTPTAEEIRDATGGKIMPVEYRGEADMKPIKNVTGDITHWQINRTRGLDAVAKRVRNTKYEFSGYGIQERVIIDHLRDMIREEAPESPAKWKKLNGVDHYFHALLFLEIAHRLPDELLNYMNADTRETVYFGGLPMQTFAPMTIS